MSRFGRIAAVLCCAAAQLLAAAAIMPTAASAATPISPDSLGVNFTGAPSDLATASASGVGVARDEVIEGTNTDAVVELTAAANLRLYPMLGLPTSHGAAADAVAMAAFVTSFAQRYGPGGSFWAQHPQLPYLPVESYEIGNEPDITPTEPADATSLHYANPADYAAVYQAARTALHQVDPTGQAVVGGMLDSGAIPLADAEQYLAAIGPMDAVGFHPYLYDVTTMEQDTTALRQWLNANGHSGVPIDINEFGAGDGVTPGVAAWGAEVAQYTQWALCTPALDVENVQPLWWGAIPMAANDPWFSMVDSGLSETPFGTAYLGEVQALTTQGCPTPPAATPPAATQSAAPTSTKKSTKKSTQKSSKKSTHKPAQKGNVHRAGKAAKPSPAKKRSSQRPRKPAARRDVRRRSSRRR